MLPRIGDVAAFEDAVRAAEKLAEQGHLVTFGITPKGPSPVSAISRPIARASLMAAGCPCAASSKNPRAKKPRNISRREATTGTRACSAFALARSWLNSRAARLRCRRRWRRRGRLRRGIRSRSRSMRTRSRGSRIFRWTMPSWKKPNGSRSCRDASTGATSVPGRRWAIWSRRIARATGFRARPCSSIPRIVSCAAKTGL